MPKPKPVALPEDARPPPPPPEEETPPVLEPEEAPPATAEAMPRRAWHAMRLAGDPDEQL